MKISELRDSIWKQEPKVQPAKAIKPSPGGLTAAHLRLDFLPALAAGHGTRKAVQKTVQDNSNSTKRELAQQQQQQKSSL